MRVSSLVLCTLVLISVLAVTSVSAASVTRRGHTGASTTLDAATGGTVAECVDVRPTGSKQYSCADQKKWGKCNASWMKGFCKKTCNKCGGGGGASHPAAGHSGSPPKPAGGHGSSLAALNINAPANRVAALKSYGATYKANKHKVVAAIKATGMSKAQQTMLFAIAMLETNTFDPANRDKSKKGPSTNYSAFNINRDMLTRAGVGNLDSMNTWAGLQHTANALKTCVHKYGINPFLNYMRGGYDAWKDGKSWDAAGYRNGIASLVKMIDAHPELWTDDRRIDLAVGHV